MKFSAVTAAIALFSGLGLAQTIQSSPFNLTVTTVDGKYKDQTLNSCHEGAAIESLCIGYGAATYYLNTTTGTQAGPGGIPGTLVWVLPSQPNPYSEALGFFTDISTNVGLPLFGIGQPVGISFDESNEMNVQSYYNDAVSPPQDTTEKAYYRWFVCETNFEGYTYETLTWVFGSAAPQNPSCVSATVTRVFQ